MYLPILPRYLVLTKHFKLDTDAEKYAISYSTYQQLLNPPLSNILTPGLRNFFVALPGRHCKSWVSEKWTFHTGEGQPEYLHTYLLIALFTPIYCTGTKRVVMLLIYLATIILTTT